MLIGGWAYCVCSGTLKGADISEDWVMETVYNKKGVDLSGEYNCGWSLRLTMDGAEAIAMVVEAALLS
jgi:hypothetical protein